MTGPTATPQREAPAPLEGPIVATVTGGTIIWFVMFLGQLPFYGWFSDHGHAWWIWTCLAGAGLGCFGIWYVRARDAAIKRAEAAEAAGDGTGDASGAATTCATRDAEPPAPANGSAGSPGADGDGNSSRGENGGA
jgi:hypothetical protein